MEKRCKEWFVRYSEPVFVQPLGEPPEPGTLYTVVSEGYGYPPSGTVLVPEGQHDPEAREALRELYEAWSDSGYIPSLKQAAAVSRAKQVLGIPERCKECGQEIRGADE